jgi:hypothetical protein
LARKFRGEIRAEAGEREFTANEGESTRERSVGNHSRHCRCSGSAPVPAILGAGFVASQKRSFLRFLGFLSSRRRDAFASTRDERAPQKRSARPDAKPQFCLNRSNGETVSARFLAGDWCVGVCLRGDSVLV